jgi:hypothetical protein
MFSSLQQFMQRRHFDFRTKQYSIAWQYAETSIQLLGKTFPAQPGTSSHGLGMPDQQTQAVITFQVLL